MGLSAGTKLGPYEILSLLGAGGMGEVWRARDTRLNREVALKVLPEALARDPERMARFKREAQVLASLNHPNIAAIYGYEESDASVGEHLHGAPAVGEKREEGAPVSAPDAVPVSGPTREGRKGPPLPTMARALVMELVEGETLAEKIFVAQAERMGKLKLDIAKSGAVSAVIPAKAGIQIPSAADPRLRGGDAAERAGVALQVDDALPIAKQIAEALEYAHERGIIHRDLKPANIKITPEGMVKVLDFGLAKALDPAATSVVGAIHESPLQDSPTLTAAATQAGVILGTAAYMSPEQARGKPVDRRADIWAFGCVLFEMLGGGKPFEGDTVTDVLAAVIKTEPDWNALASDTPPRLRELIRRCLMKDPKQRLQAIGEARIAIEETIAGHDSVATIYDHRNVQHSSTLQSEGERRSTLKMLRWVAFAILVGVAGVGGWWFGMRSAPAPITWSGELLPGPTVAFWPRVSPDGRLVAFQALVDNISQVAVMDPASGNWSVLTNDREHGLVGSLSWSPDGSRIYFDRFTSQPLGIYTVPSLGGEAREVLGNAASPEPLPDGSLLVVRVDPDRKSQIYHFWPDTGKLQAMGAWAVLSPAAPMRVFPDGKDAVFFGTAEEEASDKSPHLYLLDISTGSAMRLAPELPIVQTAQIFPLAVTPDGQSVLIDLPSGNLHRVVAIPRSGASTARTLMSLTSGIWCLDEAREGSLYVDQVDRPFQVLKYPVTGGTPEVLESVEDYPVSAPNGAPTEFPDGRMILPALISGRSRLLIGQPGGSFVPLLQTHEETGTPVIRVGDSQVALMVGSGSKQALTLASVKEGRILRRFDDTEGKPIDTIAASPDGRTLYYVSSGSVWSVPSDGGDSHKLCAGDGVAVDPNGRDLVVNLLEQQNVRLERVPLSGGAPQEISVKSDAPIVPIPLGPDTINRSGKMLVGVVPNDSWFFRQGILDLSTGAVTRVPLNYAGDIFVSAWANDNRILSSANPIRAHIWRFSSVESKSQ